MLVFYYSTLCSDQILRKLQISPYICEKYSNPLEWFHVEVRTDRHYEANSRFTQFCHSA